MGTSKRGFASMSSEKQKRIASEGGKAAHKKGTAHQFTSDEARDAGSVGGRTVARDLAHMSAIGRVGGRSRGARARTKKIVRDVKDMDDASLEEFDELEEERLE